MNTYSLRIQHQGKIDIILLKKGETLVLPVLSDAIYEIINEQGEVIQTGKNRLLGQDLHFFVEQEDQPSLILEDFSTLYPQESLATAHHLGYAVDGASENNEVMAKAQNIATEIDPIKSSSNNIGSFFGAKTYSIQANEINNIATSVNQSISQVQKLDTKKNTVLISQDEVHTKNELDAKPNEALEQPIEAEDIAVAPTQPIETENTVVAPAKDAPKAELDPLIIELHTNPISPITQANIQNQITISGQVAVNDSDANLQITVEIDGQAYPANINNDTWSVNILGQALAYLQGEANAQVRVQAHSGTRHATQQATATYQVDTRIDASVITLDPIAEDGVISAVEARQEQITLTGRVSNPNPHANAQAGDIIHFQLGEAYYTAEVKDDLSFSVNIDTITLVKHQAISARMVTRDDVGNQIESETQAAYVVKSIAKPVIKLDTFAGNDILTDAEANGDVTISGTVQDGYDGQIVRVRCGCPSCSGEKWVEADGIIRDGKFTATFNGAEIISVLGDSKVGTITADYTATSSAQQSSQADQAHKIFIRRDDKSTVEAFFETYMGDNIINKQEANSGDFAAPGKGLWLRGILNIPEGIKINNIVVFSGEHQFKMNQRQINENGQIKQVFVNASRKHIPKSLFEQKLETEFNVRVEFTRADGSQGILTSAPVGISKPLKIIYDVIDPTLTVSALALAKPISQTSAPYSILSGHYSVEDNYAFNSDSVEIKITLPTGKQYIATVDKDNHTWQVELPTEDLIYQQGKNHYDISITGTDVAGNSASVVSQGTYLVDTVGPMMQLEFLSIGEHNQVQAETNEKEKHIVISGKLTGEFKSGELVTLKLKDSAIVLGQAVLNTQGEFSLAVDNDILRNATNPTVEINYSTTDNEGNSGSLNGSQRYSIANGDIRITLDPIASDDLINVTEAILTNGNQTVDFTITGSIAGSKAEGVTTVTLNLNGVEKNVLIHPTDKTFSTTYSFSELKQATDYRISASVHSLDNSANATATAVYDIAPDAIAKIDITEIGENFTLNPVTTTRIKGTVEFDAVYAQGQNAHLLRSINLRIGDKTYTAGFRGKDKSFFVDIPNEELVALHGQRITADFEVLADSKPVRFAYELTQNQKTGAYHVHSRKNIPVQIKTLTFEKNDVIAEENGQFSINKPTVDMTTVRGVVSGVAKNGDEVRIDIGDNSYTARVENQGFQLNIRNSDLRQGKRLKATLITQDAAGKTIQVNDVEHYLVMNDVKGTFVSQHSQVQKTNVDHKDAGYNFAYFIDGVDFRGAAYRHIPMGGGDEAAVIKYHFVNATADNLVGQNRPQAEGIINRDSYVNFKEDHKNTIRAAYRSIEEFINVRFEESAEMLERFHGTRLYRAKLTGNGSGSSAIAWPGGDLVWNDFWGGGNGTNTYTSYTALHEISHTLQMNHTERFRAGKFQVERFYENEDNTEFTLMSYNTDGAIDFRSLRMFDLAFLHYRFGVSKTARTGNDTYSFKDYNFNSADGALYIWDGGGVDTFDASKESQGVTVNLTPGSWIYRGEELSQYFAVKGKNVLDRKSYFGLEESAVVNGGFGDNGRAERTTIKEYTDGQAFIGYGTQIENLIGSNFADVLTGNNADNNIFGGDGDDIIKGGNGNDRLDGGKGADQLYGEAGDDVYIVDNAGDQVFEAADQGVDSVFSVINYRLTDNVENLTLIGTTATEATGNALNNILTANNQGNRLDGGDGNDRLVGGLGADTLIGGNDSDTFVFATALNGTVDNLQDFNVAEDKIELAKAIFTEVSKGMDNLADYLRYDDDSGALSYDSDGVGKTDPIHFANLPLHLQFDQIRFEVI
ncbi:Ig-like domain-containing protein [[Haemophilus] felis]|nr:Ig-like domain-containing protein [[Haemophilus] felis]